MAAQIRLREISFEAEQRGDDSEGMSAREYTEYQFNATQKAEVPSWGFYGYGGHDAVVILTIYVDELTGLVVRDIESFEKWIAST